jgi:hypothetical protein
MPLNGKDILEKANVLKNGGTVDAVSAKKRAAFSGAFVGAAAGFYYGYVKQDNFLVAGILGAIAGALIARVVMPKQ